MQESFDSRSSTKEHPDLYQKTIKAGHWVIFLRLAINILGFGKTLVIANFFHLENLGIISIALMTTKALSTLTQTGFDAALVQKKGDIRTYLDTAWVARLVKGVVLFLVLFLSAPLLASIRVSDDKFALAVSVLRAISVCFLLEGLGNIGTVYFRKNLNFSKVFALSVATSLADICVCLGLIFILRSIWAVVTAYLVSACISCLCSYLLSPYRPRFRFEMDKARELWRYGKWICGQGILGYVLAMGDDFFVWFYLGVPELALYRYAYNFSNLPATHITSVISSVSFPAYSKIQGDIQRLRDAFLKIVRVTAFFAIPVSFQIFALGPDFVRLFLKDHMQPIILALQVLALKGLINALGSTRGPLFRAMGRPDITWRLHWLRVAVLAITIYPLTQAWGFAGTGISTILAGVFVNPVASVISARMLKCTIWQILKPSSLPLLASIIMFGGMASLMHVGPGHLTHLSFFGVALVGSFLYLGALYTLDRVFKHGHIELIGEQASHIKRGCRLRDERL